MFIILMVTNASSLYVVKWFKARYPDKPSASNFTLLFKNVEGSVDELVGSLKAEFGEFSVYEAFVIKQA